MPIICTPEELVEHNVMWKTLSSRMTGSYSMSEIVATSEGIGVSTPANENGVASPWNRGAAVDTLHGDGAIVRSAGRRAGACSVLWPCNLSLRSEQFYHGHRPHDRARKRTWHT